MFSKLYVVTNPEGVSVRKTMSTLNNLPVGKMDNGMQFPVYQEYTTNLFGQIYTWGRITEEPDANGQHRYVALYRSSGKTWCKEVLVPKPTGPVSNSDVMEYVMRLERRIVDLEAGVKELKKNFAS